jgi:uncharacterized protein YndB with AHSA1/START domain
MQPPGDAATVTVTVAVEPAVAFEVFTRETDLWWRRGVKYRVAGRRPGVLAFEPGVGGGLFESFETETGAKTFEVGRVTAWEPPHRLLFEWRNANFAPGERTEVEVLFEEVATGTKVTLQHRGWASLRPGHPARHDLEPAAFSRMIGLWWGELLSSLREHAA